MRQYVAFYALFLTPKMPLYKYMKITVLKIPLGVINNDMHDEIALAKSSHWVRHRVNVVGVWWFK